MFLRTVLLGVGGAIMGVTIALVDSEMNWHWAKGCVVGLFTGVVANLLIEYLGLNKIKPWWKWFR